MKLYSVGKRKVFYSFLIAVVAFMSMGQSASAADGKELFEVNCKSCHHPLKNGIGPKLQGVRALWADGAGDDQLIYTWVNNYEDAVKQSPFAAERMGINPAQNMKLFPQLSKADMDAIFDYADAFTGDETAAGGGGAAGGGDVALKEDEGLSYWWIIVLVILAIVVFAAAGVRRQLRQVEKMKAGEDTGETENYKDIAGGWAARNQKAVGIIGAICLFAFLVTSFGWLKGIGVYENYNPSQPVAAFSHKIHAGDQKIDCQYCHNSASKSKHAGLPTMNVCMNCHRSVEGASEEGKKSIAYLREHAGFDGEKYTGETEAIVWNRVYVLPDHVYFSHAQHVDVGGLDCKNCHGEMEKQTLARVVESSEAIPVGDNPENQLTRPTLTMGWCIECHNNTQVTIGPNLDGNVDQVSYYEEIHRRLTKRPDIYKKYADDEKITVRELGGWECAKCHY